jgi:branched-chain amino acid transport system ATP-binding protein
MNAMPVAEPGMRALRVIEDEHRSLAAVLHGLLYIVREIRLRGSEPDFELLGAMLYYIDAFPERFHHPKEDAYLFRCLRARDPGSAGLLDRLEGEHREGVRRIADLNEALARYRKEGIEAFGSFAQQVAEFANFHWEHMRAEEQDVLPRARRHLVAADWAEIDTAFADNDDPLLGTSARDNYRQLFRKIVNLAPPPLGVGPPR